MDCFYKQRTLVVCFFLVTLALAGCSGEETDPGSQPDSSSQRPDGAVDNTDDTSDTTGSTDTSDSGEEPGPSDAIDATDSRDSDHVGRAHACPSDGTCAVYGYNKETENENTEGSVWFASSSDRIELTASSEVEGEVDEVQVGPSGRYILFYQDFRPEGAGTPSYYISDLATDGEPKTGSLVGKIGQRTVTFDPDGNYVWFSYTGETVNATLDPGLYYVELGGSVDSMEPKRVMDKPATSGRPRFSSDGEWMYFSANDLENENESIYRIKSGDTVGEPQLIFDPGTLDGHSLKDWEYFPRSNHIAFDVKGDESGKYFAKKAVPDAKTSAISGPVGFSSKRSVEEISVSRDGTKMAVVLMDRESFGDDYGTLKLRLVDASHPFSKINTFELGTGAVENFASQWLRNSSSYLVSLGPPYFGTAPDSVSRKLMHIDTEKLTKTDITGHLPAQLQYGDAGSNTVDEQDPMWRRGPDGKLYFRAASGYSEGPGIYQTAGPKAQASEAVEITDKTTGAGGWFQFSSDGDHIFYKADPEYAQGFELFVAPSTDPGNATRLSQQPESKNGYVAHVAVVEPK